MYDTIAAIATPAGTGAIGIIRLSGNDAIAVADRCFRAKSAKSLTQAKTHTLHFGYFVNPQGDIIDECLASVFIAPKSYTGENSVEFSMHGNPLILRDALSALLYCGARQALGGEFTKRAFLNGKLDLSQAEAVADLIDSQSRTEAILALSHLNGKTGEAITAVRIELTELNAAIMAYIDYSFEDLSDVSNETVKEVVEKNLKICESLLKTYDTGRVLKDGVKCAIIGKPNAGKSSLMNLLAGFNRSIVTDTPGTTRDMIEETVIIDGIKLRIFDTAGIRDTVDKIERLGVEMTRSIISKCELVFCVFDSSTELDDYDREIISLTDDINRVALLNKSDLPNKINRENIEDNFKHVVYISALTGEGIDTLSSKLAELFQSENLSTGTDIIMSARQKDCLVKASESLKEALIAVENGYPPDIAGISINDAISALGEITGQTVNDEIIDEIFRKFCVGK